MPIDVVCVDEEGNAAEEVWRARDEWPEFGAPGRGCHGPLAGPCGVRVDVIEGAMGRLPALAEFGWM